MVQIRGGKLPDSQATSDSEILLQARLRANKLLLHNNINEMKKNELILRNLSKFSGPDLTVWWAICGLWIKSWPCCIYTKCFSVNIHYIDCIYTNLTSTQVFFKENVRHPVWICGDPIFSDSRDSVIIFSDSRARFSILGIRTRIGSLKHLKNPASTTQTKKVLDQAKFSTPVVDRLVVLNHFAEWSQIQTYDFAKEPH